MISNYLLIEVLQVLQLSTFLRVKIPDWVASVHFLVGHPPPFQLLLSIDKSQRLSPASTNLKKSGQLQLLGSNLILPPIRSGDLRLLARAPPRLQKLRDAFWGLKKPLF